MLAKIEDADVHRIDVWLCFKQCTVDGRLLMALFSSSIHVFIYTNCFFLEICRLSLSFLSTTEQQQWWN